LAKASFSRKILLFFFNSSGSACRYSQFSPAGKEAELGQVGIQAVDVHIEDVQVGVTAVVDEVAQVTIVGSIHLENNEHMRCP
jgi:hypothetical protein